MNWLVWFLIRCAVTLGCVWTLQNIIHREGYRAEFGTLLLAAIVTIVCIRFWIPNNNV